MIKVESVDQLKLGDVVVDVPIRDRETGTEHIWRRYACVTFCALGAHYVRVLTLKMRVTDEDTRVINIKSQRETIWKVPEEDWPDGVVAMRMKHITTGLIKLDGP